MPTDWDAVPTHDGSAPGADWKIRDGRSYPPPFKMAGGGVDRELMTRLRHLGHLDPIQFGPGFHPCGCKLVNRYGVAGMLPRCDQDWHAHRKESITASELGTAMGLNRHDSLFNLWWHKKDPYDWAKTKTTDPMDFGNRLEAAVLSRYASEHRDLSVYAMNHRASNLAEVYNNHNGYDRSGGPTGPSQEIFRVPVMEAGGCPRWWLAVSPDGAANHPDGRHNLVECKTTGSWDDWGPAGSGIVPGPYRAQVHAQMVALGGDYVDIPVLGFAYGRLEYREYRVHRDPVFEAKMLAAGSRFARSLAEDVPPEVDSSEWTTQALRDAYPVDAEADPVEVDLETVQQWRHARHLEKLAKERKQLFANRLRQQLGQSRVGTVEGNRVISRSDYQDRLIG